MSFPSVLYGPESEVRNLYSFASPRPADYFGGRFPMGTQLVCQDGRKYRFAHGSGVKIAGDVQQSAAVIATDVNMSAVVGLAGSNSVTFTHGAATVVANYFAEGYCVIEATSAAVGAGYSYKILRHAALTSSGTDEVILAPGHNVVVTLTATTAKVGLVSHPYANTVLMAATISGAPVGVAVSLMASAGFGWLQTRGIGAVRAAASNTIGSPGVMLLTGGTAGAVAPASAATQPAVGLIHQIGVTFASVFINIDG